ncbi:hypothetical protein ABDJ41_10790 [Pedobacter sp. ASV1-7]|jgi:hypothetical protein|uniref:hypothetical protein n=1 Tax=Pedobacter sp. ASV1-7 TaxID=3145237 RepID=UPI0032E89138
METKYFKISLILSLMIVCSCNNSIQKGVEGFWTIDKIVYKKKDFFFDVLSNIIIFKNKDCTLPILDLKDAENLGVLACDKKGRWKVFTLKSNNSIIEFDTENEMFRGKHNIRFIKDEHNKLLKMEITSPNLYILCTKGLVNYDSQNNMIEELVQETN